MAYHSRATAKRRVNFLKIPLSILIIDDNLADANSLARQLTKLSFWQVDYSICKTGEEALALIREEDRDVVIADYMLESETGVDIIRSFKEIGSSAAFILLTRMGDEQIVIEALREGAYDYLKKDELTPDILNRSVRHVIERRLIEEEREVLMKFPDENPNPILRVARDNTILYANPASQSILKSYNCDIGHTLPDSWKTLIEEVLDSGLSKNKEIQIKDHIYSFVITPLTNTYTVYLYGQDITDREYAEKTLQKNEVKNQALIKLIPDMMFRINKSGIYLDFKPAKGFDPMLSSSDFLGKNIHEIMPTQVAQQTMIFVEKALMTGETQLFEYQLFTQDDIKDYEARIVVSGDNEVLALVRDITERKKVEEELQFQAQIIDQLPNPVIITDMIGYVTGWNEGAEKLFGYRLEEALGQHILFLLLEEEHDFIQQKLVQLLKEKVSHEIETRMKKKSGDLFFAHLILSLYRNKDSFVTGIIGYVIDITERKRAEDALRLNAKVFENTSEALMITDIQANILSVNQAFSKITGYSQEEAIGKNTRILKSGRHNKQFYKNMWKLLKKLGSWQGEIQDRRKSGEIYPKWLTINSVKDNSGKVTHYVAIFSDITKRKQTEERLEYLAHYDTLTGLPNRHLFHDRLQQALVRAEQSNLQIALLFIDLDRFKNINDTFGHTVADQLLIDVSKRLANFIRKIDTVSRFGGDEFIIILTDVTSAKDVALKAQKIMALISKPFVLEGQELFITLSVGITSYPLDGENMDQLVKNSYTSMNHAKKLGRNNYQFYSSEMNSKALEQLNMEIDLRKALEREEFRLYYQPKISFKTGELVGAEALIRWYSAKSGLISPEKFIPLAEETGLIIPISEWVFLTACKQIKEWQTTGFPSICVSVNLSGRHFKEKNLVEMVEQVLEQTGLDPNYLELELTESAIMDNVEQGIITLNRLKNMGIYLAIDDFGTGYSSFSYLKRFPVDILKIDQSFVSDITTDSDSAAIVSAIISVGHSLNLKVIAEGVETEDQFHFLSEHQCDEAQGYYFSKPLSVKEFSLLLKKSKSFSSVL